MSSGPGPSSSINSARTPPRDVPHAKSPPVRIGTGESMASSADSTSTGGTAAMDDVLLATSLKSVDGRRPSVPIDDVPFAQHPFPHIFAPVQPRFTDLLRGTRVSIDIGGTLIKVVFSSAVTSPGDGKSSERRLMLSFRKFASIDLCLGFVQTVWKTRTSSDFVYCTGGGAYKYSNVIEDRLGVKIHRVDEMQSLIRGCDFLLAHNIDESFTYHHEAAGIERYQYKVISHDSVYPFLLVNIGTGTSILKVESPTSFQRVGGSSMGGGAFIGLGHLLTKAKDFDELLRLAERGDHRHVDTLVSDIYGEKVDQTRLGLSGDVIAGSFGKCNRFNPHNAQTNAQAPKSEADQAKSLLFMISNTVGQLAWLYADKFKLRKIYFGGFFIRKHPITMRTLTYAIQFYGKSNVECLFLKHEGYLGAMGAFLDGLPQE